jgi:hypothetical protein
MARGFIMAAQNMTTTMRRAKNRARNRDRNVSFGRRRLFAAAIALYVVDGPHCRRNITDAESGKKHNNEQSGEREREREKAVLITKSFRFSYR